MSNNNRGQSLISKYVWIIETIYQQKKISFKELNDKWISDFDISRGIDIPKRTFDNWRYAIWDIFGINIINESRGDYRYYIENEDDIHSNSICSWLYNALCVGNMPANSQNIKERILLEHIPSSQKYLQAIIKAMKKNNIININYHSYRKDEENNVYVQPYCVKLFRLRWYMVGKASHSHHYEQGLRIYALDRIHDLTITEETFKIPEEWSAEEFFEGCFGIIATHKIDMQDIKLKVTARQANYIRDLKIHVSQEEIERNDSHSIFKYFLRPEFDFIQEILWNGDEVEVLEPSWLRQEITEKIKRMLNKYNQ